MTAEETTSQTWSWCTARRLVSCTFGVTGASCVSVEGVSGVRDADAVLHFQTKPFLYFSEGVSLKARSIKRDSGP